MSRRFWGLWFPVLEYCWPVITVVLVYVSIPMLIVAYWLEGPSDAGMRYVERRS